MAKLTKPPAIKNNRFMSAKWDEITEGRTFSASDIPQLKQLCIWYAVIEQCMVDMEQDESDLPRVAYMNEVRDIKSMPQLSTMKQASAEIRALNKQLGINDEAKADKPKAVTVVSIVRGNRQKRAAKTAKTG